MIEDFRCVSQPFTPTIKAGKDSCNWICRGVLPRIYRLGETSRVAKGIPPPPESFWNEYALRCNLVHFETIFRNVTVVPVLYFIFWSWSCSLSYCVLRQGIPSSCALTSSRMDDFSDIVTIFAIRDKVTSWIEHILSYSQPEPALYASLHRLAVTIHSGPRAAAI